MVANGGIGAHRRTTYLTEAEPARTAMLPALSDPLHLYTARLNTVLRSLQHLNKKTQ